MAHSTSIHMCMHAEFNRSISGFIQPSVHIKLKLEDLASYLSRVYTSANNWIPACS